MQSSKTSTKKLEDFIEKRELNAKMVTGKHINAVRIFMKKSPAEMQQVTRKYTNPWFLKTIPAKEEAFREVIAQEFFRFLFPYFPKTRLLIHDDKYYVLSKGIARARPIQLTHFKNNIHQGKMTGFGYILLASLLGEEIDLKYQNMCVDNQKRLVRFDGGWCFASLTEKFKDKNFGISDSDLSALPYLPEQYAYNWLEVIMDDVRQPDSIYIDQSMAVDGHPVRGEINQAILYALMVPRELVEIFVSQYIPASDSMNDKLVKTLTKRLDELTLSALQNTSFCRYLMSDKANEDFNKQLDNLKVFKTTNKNKLIDQFKPLEEMTRARFLELRDAVKTQLDEEKRSRLDEEKREEVMLEVTGGITDKDVAEIKLCISEAIKEKIKKNKSIFTRRDKELENKRILIWLDIANSDTIIPAIFKAVLVDVIGRNVEVTRSRYAERHQGETLEDKKMDLGKIYETMAQKLISIAPLFFYEIIKTVALDQNVKDVDVFFKNMKHHFTEADIKGLQFLINWKRRP